MKDHPYIPALRFSWLTRFYDPLLRVTLKEDKFKGMLVRQANVQPSHRVLDLGCGTATLTLLLKQAQPAAEVIGLDGDPEILEQARKKSEKMGISIQLVQGLSNAPPFEAASLDRVVSSLFFHHLLPQDKLQTLQQTFTLLKSGGELHIADWGKPQNLLMRVAFLSVQLLDGFATTTDNVHGKLIPMMQEAGFLGVKKTHELNTIFGTLALYQARKG